MLQRVSLAAAFGAASAGAALIEQDRMGALGIEPPAMIGLATAAGTAVQIDGGDAVGAADAFDVNLVTIADGEQLRRQRRKWIGALVGGLDRAGVRRHRRRP